MRYDVYNSISNISQAFCFFKDPFKDRKNDREPPNNNKNVGSVII